MVFQSTNAYYFSHLNTIGGVESHFYYLAKKYNAWDLCVYYRSGDPIQINRLKKFIRVKQMTPSDKLVCDRLFFCYNLEILNQCESPEKIYVLHGDYLDLVNRGYHARAALPLDSRITKYIGVSQLVCDSWKTLTGIDAECVYNPIVLEPTTRPLMLVSATRLTREKGWNRMKKLAEFLDNNGVNYIWFVYTDATEDKTKKKIQPLPNMVFAKPRLDVTNKLPAFDAYIQLSDNEGYCLSVVEALMRGLPVICTDLPVLKELGLNETNSIILDMELNNVNIDEIVNIKNKKFTYTPPEDRWGEMLIHVPSTYNPNKAYHVRATGAYKELKLIDVNLGRIPEPGEEFDVIGDDRLEMLLGHNSKYRPFVELIN